MSDPKAGKNLTERDLRALSNDDFLALIQQDLKDLDQAWKERRRNAAAKAQSQPPAAPAEAAPPQPPKPGRPAKPAPPPPKPGDVVQSRLLTPEPGHEPRPATPEAASAPAAPAAPASRRRRSKAPGAPAKPAGDSLEALLEEARSEMPPDDLDVFHSITCCNVHLGDFPPIARVRCPFCDTWHKAGDHPRTT